MKRLLSISAVLIITAALFTSCLSTTIKRELPPPWTPQMSAAAADQPEPPVNEKVPVHWLTDSVSIDGDFSEWTGLESVKTRVVVFGSYHDPADAEGEFKLATDGESLFIYASVSDDTVNENALPGALAWRGDSVEVFFGTDTTRHTGFRTSDNQIRIVPRNRDDIFDYELSVNDVSRVQYTEAAVVFTESGYTLEAMIPLSLMRIDGLKPGQKIRAEFQVNDADETERDRLLHWMSPKDDPWFNASVWGDGQVQKEE